MEIPKDYLLDDIYDSEYIQGIATSDEYNKLRRKYNELFDTIKDTELRNKLEKLEELKNAMMGEDCRNVFKQGCSYAIRFMVESLNFNLQK